MNDIHDLLSRHRVSPGRPLKKTFTNDILKSIASEPHRLPLAGWFRFAIPEVRMRLLQLPKAALIGLAIVAAGTGTAAAYSAYTWLVPKINILGITAHNDDNKREFVVNIADCGVMVGGEAASNGQNQRYEVSPDAHLSDAQVMKVLQNSCDYQQILDMMNNHWKEDAQIMGQHAGDAIDITTAGAGGENVINDPWVGKITALDASHISIDSTVYQQYNGKNVYMPGETVPDASTLTTYYPHGKTISRTLELKPGADVVYNGNTIARDQLKVGDTIVFISQIKGTIGTGYTRNITSTQVAHIIKTDIDPAYVQPMWVGDPSIVNAIARLDTCPGNSGYLCLASKSMQLHFQTVYSYTGNTETSPTPDSRFVGNEKYFRADINLNSSDSGKNYRAIEGRIASLNGSKMTLLSRGKVQSFTVTLPYDAVAQFNQTAKQKVAVGDYVQVNYMQKDTEDHTIIKASDIMGLSQLQRQLGDGSYAKY
ncbi:MAG TPA: hypothetical protein VLH86_03190 [Patescibacteria group bacterium]|nr:hypothetical protein [Patescibacteria group bacterium]